MDPGLAARIVVRAGSVARTGLATATLRSDKRTVSPFCCCMSKLDSCTLLRQLDSDLLIQFTLCDSSQLASCLGTFWHSSRSHGLIAIRRAISVVIP